MFQPAETTGAAALTDPVIVRTAVASDSPGDIVRKEQTQILSDIHAHRNRTMALAQWTVAIAVVSATMSRFCIDVHSHGLWLWWLAARVVLGALAIERVMYANKTARWDVVGESYKVKVFAVNIILLVYFVFEALARIHTAIPLSPNAIAFLYIDSLFVSSVLLYQIVQLCRFEFVRACYQN